MITKAQAFDILRANGSYPTGNEWCNVVTLAAIEVLHDYGTKLQARELAVAS
jgi:hypothetical protein